MSVAFDRRDYLESVVAKNKAHRFNTIENAGEISFVNAGEVVLAGSFDQAVWLFIDNKPSS